MAFEIKKPSKPRQVRGTTAYKYRNWFAIGMLVTSGLSWFLYEQLPASKKIVEQINAGYWDRSDEDSYRLEMIRRNLTPDTKDLLRRKTELMSKKEDPPKMIEI